MRTAKISRKTNETDITVELNLDSQSGIEIDTGVGFFNHMLDLFAKHGRFGLKVKANGDLDVDVHHTVRTLALYWVNVSNKRWEPKSRLNASATVSYRWMKHSPRSQWTSVVAPTWSSTLNLPIPG